MADFTTCPVKAPVIGNAGYLRWVQFCENRCPLCGDDAKCHTKTADISFPLDSREMDPACADEVKAAWEAYDSF